MWYLRNELNTATKLDYYLAVIIYSIYRSQADKKFRMKPEDFLLKFQFDDPSKLPKTVEERTRYWKQVFHAITSVGGSHARS